MEAEPGLDHLGERFAGLHALHSLGQSRINVLDGLERLKIQVTAGRSGAWVFRIIPGDGGEVLAALDVPEQAARLGPRLLWRLGVVIFPVMEFRIGDGGYQNVSDVVTFGQVKTFFILIVEILDFCLGYGNLRRDLLIDELIDGDALTQFGTD